MNKVIRELLNKYGTMLALAIWEIIKPVVIEQIIEGAKDFTELIFKKVKSILTDRDETLEETILFNLEKAKQKASESTDIKKIDYWNTKAEDWEEFYGLITKDSKKTMKQIDNLEVDSFKKSENILDINNKQFEEEVINRIKALPE